VPTRSKTSSKIVLCWINLGHYHVARASALAIKTDLTVLEFARSHKIYGWEIDRSQLPFEVVTLSKGAWEDQSMIDLAKKCWEILERIRPTGVVVPGYSNPIALAIAIWGCFRGVPRILMTESTSGDRRRNQIKENLKSLLINWLFSGASYGGKPQLRYLEQLRFDIKKSAPFYNVVDNDFFATSSSAFRKGNQPSDFSLPPRYFLFVGRMAPEKNIDLLLKAFAEYRRTGGQAHLVLAGEGPLRISLQTLAENLGVTSQCHFMGNLDARQLLPLYAFADAFVLPSTSEPWGLVVNEAMAAGLPVIVSNHCGCAEDLVSDGQNGYLFDPGRKDQLAACLSRIDSLPVEQLADMRRVSRNLIQVYSPENWAKHLVELIDTLQEKTGRSPVE